MNTEIGHGAIKVQWFKKSLTRIILYGSLLFLSYLLVAWTNEDGYASSAGLSKTDIVMCIPLLGVGIYFILAPVLKHFGVSKIEYLTVFSLWMVATSILIFLDYGFPLAPSYLVRSPGRIAETTAKDAARNATTSGNCYVVRNDAAGILTPPYEICADQFPYQGHAIEVFFTKKFGKNEGSGYAYSAVGGSFDLHGVCSLRISRRWWSYVPSASLNPICPRGYRYTGSG